MKIKVIDLLNMISKGGEVPKKIKYDDNIYVVNKIVLEKGKNDIDYYCNDNCEMLFADVIPIHRCLNEEVEILEEKEICHKCGKYNAEYNQTYCEFCLGISKLEEEKKIPEKLVGEDKGHYIDYSVCNIVGKINEIIDYLKSKGE